MSEDEFNKSLDWIDENYGKTMQALAESEKKDAMATESGICLLSTHFDCGCSLDKKVSRANIGAILDNAKNVDEAFEKVNKIIDEWSKGGE